MIKKNTNFLGVMILTSLIISCYQLPLIQNTLIKNGYNNNLNEKIPFSKNFQEYVESQKITFSAFLEKDHHEENYASNIQIPQEFFLLKQPIEKVEKLAENNITQLSDINVEEIKGQNLIPLTNKVCVDKCSILMIGDSMMGDVNFAMNRIVKKQLPKWKVIDGHKVSSGLSNDTYYDWGQISKKLIEKHKPDYVFILLGMNDAQGIMLKGKALDFNSPLWSESYSYRANNIVQIMENSKSIWHWVELPVTKSPKFNKRLKTIRDIQSDVSKKNYVSVEYIFGENDNSNSIDMSLRNTDGVHLNSVGAEMIAKDLLKKIKN